MSLKLWYLKRLAIPLAGLGALMLIAVSFSTLHEIHQRKSEVSNLVRKTADFVNLAFDQKNNSLIETSLTSLLHQTGSEGVAICADTEEIISIGRQSICEMNGSGFFTSFEKIPLSASLGKSIILKKNDLNLYNEFIFLLTLTIIFLFLTIAICGYTLKRFLLEILDPMTNGGLNSHQKLAISELNTIRENNLKFIQAEMRQAVLEALVEKNAQVAHDIRSPLTALSMIAKLIQGMNNGADELLMKAVNRIKEITNDLKNQNSALLATQQELAEKEIKHFNLIKTLKEILAEKKCEFQECENLSLALETFDENLVVLGSKVEFGRVLSNLINNSKEASERQSLTQIIVQVRRQMNFAQIQIWDNGPGFPPEILPHLGSRGLTFNKCGGSGLGTYHAVKAIKQMAGQIQFQNIENSRGTVTSILLPLSTTLEMTLESNICSLRT